MFKSLRNVSNLQSQFPLRLLHSNLDVFVPPEYRKNIKDSADVFEKYIDPGFSDVTTVSSDTRTVSVYKADGTYVLPEALKAIGDISDLCLAQWQVVEFCRRYPSFFIQSSIVIPGSRCLLFLLGEGQVMGFKVARVYHAMEGLEVQLYESDVLSVSASACLVVQDHS